MSAWYASNGPAGKGLPSLFVTEELVAGIDEALRAQADPVRAADEKRYLKSSLEHWGVSVPAIRTTVKRALRARPGLGHDDVVAVVEDLWVDPVHERRMAAIEVLDARSSVLGPADLDLLERLLRQCGTWAYVDNLAASVVGSVVARHPDETGPVLDRWAVDDDVWIRRSALLALLGPLRQGGGDPERFFRYADLMLDEKEFFIRKAIGWVLRDTARKRPDLVFEWVLPRASRLSGVTYREVVKPLSDDQVAALDAAR